MKARILVLLLLVVVVACKKKKEATPDPAPGSSMASKGSGSGSDHGSGSGHGSGHGSGEMLVPHDVPLTGPALAKHYLECAQHLNEGHVDEVKKHCLDEKLVVHEMDFSAYEGLESVTNYLTTMRTAMPDFKQEPQLVLVAGKVIVSINLVRGKHSGPLKGPDGKEVAATNKSVGVLSYDHVLTNEQNKTIEKWEFMDHNALLGQLGIDAGTPTRPAIAKGWEGAPIVLVAKEDAAEQANIALITKQTDAFNAGKTADMAALWADDVVESDQGAHEDHKGKDAIEKDLKDTLAAFPDAKANTTHVFASGDYVFVEGRLTGTHKGPLGTLKPTNRKVDAGFADVYKIKNGKIAEMWRFRDSHALVDQLTAKAEPAPKPGKGSAAPKGSGAK